jgi:hypothetical protein
MFSLAAIAAGIGVTVTTESVSKAWQFGHGPPSGRSACAAGGAIATAKEQSAICVGRIRVSTRGRRRLKRLSGGGHNILRLQSHSGGHAQYGPTWGKQLAGRGSGARIAAHLRGVFPFMKSTGVPLCTRCASACASQLVRRMQP